MNIIKSLLAAALLMPLACGAGALKTEKQKISYAIGLDVGNSVGRVKEQMNSASMLEGMKDSMEGKEPKMKPEELMPVMQGLQARMQNPAAPKASKEDMEKVGYAIGLDIGKGLGRFKDEVEFASIASGIKDRLEGKEPRLKTEELGPLMQAFQERVQKQAGEKNRTEGEAYLAKNKQKAGVKVTASGLQYEVLTAGTGRKPKASEQVKVHYKGTLVDGTEFDSSYKRGQPATFGVTQVIPGWVEALQMMPVGSKWRLTIPGNLAYGERGAPGGTIGPDATLLFDVELLEIVKK